MDLQVIFTIANHLWSFAEDACPQDVGSVLNANGRVLGERDDQALLLLRSFVPSFLRMAEVYTYGNNG